ncbi:hypothetical protein EYF80_010058 [Liparis tanakae]|uniref:Uncharacterized protein n=1 Tax=Liparis tanakae TaxID=230148 RepID=A0A4Z2IQ91_9TELE|nr:hypothetical protein EYF80_010058 [Liparis tanakae]
MEEALGSQAAAARVRLPRAHTALGHLPPAPLLSGASHAQGTLVTGHAVWYRVPMKKDTDAGASWRPRAYSWDRRRGGRHGRTNTRVEPTLKLDDELPFIVAAAGVLCVVLAALHGPHSTEQTLDRLENIELAGQEKRLKNENKEASKNTL